MQRQIAPPADWDDWIHICGFFFLDNPNPDWKASESLLKFLQDRSKKIVYIGFGSIVVDDPDGMTDAVVEAVQKAGVKAILAKGWSGRKQTASGASAVERTYPDCIYPLNAVPHDWLFPQLDGVVHHGGAGTTAAGLRAGLPTVIKPFFGDQFFWGDRVSTVWRNDWRGGAAQGEHHDFQMGVGVMVRELSAENLAQALKTIVSDKAMQAKAKLAAAKIAQESGVDLAIEAFQRDWAMVQGRTNELKRQPGTTTIEVTHVTERPENKSSIGDTSPLSWFNLTSARSSGRPNRPRTESTETQSTGGSSKSTLAEVGKIDGGGGQGACNNTCAQAATMTKLAEENRALREALRQRDDENKQLRGELEALRAKALASTSNRSKSEGPRGATGSETLAPAPLKVAPDASPSSSDGDLRSREPEPGATRYAQASSAATTPWLESLRFGSADAPSSPERRSSPNTDSGTLSPANVPRRLIDKLSHRRNKSADNKSGMPALTPP